MPGLYDPAKREPSTENTQRVGGSLQPGPPALRLGPGIPNPPMDLPEKEILRSYVPRDHRVVAKSVLGGLHHEYRLEKVAA